MSETILIINYFLIVILVCFSALFSGLTLGLLGLDLIGLEIVINGDDEVLKEKAAKIKPVRENGNMLLCTLLLGNVAVNAYLSILMADLTSGFVGFAVGVGVGAAVGLAVGAAVASVGAADGADVGAEVGMMHAAAREGAGCEY